MIVRRNKQFSLELEENQPGEKKKKALKVVGTTAAIGGTSLLGSYVGGRIADNKIKSGNWYGKNKLTKLQKKVENAYKEELRARKAYAENPHDSLAKKMLDASKQHRDSWKKWIDKGNKMDEVEKKYRLGGKTLGALAGAGLVAGGLYGYKKYKNRKNKDTERN